MNIEYLIAGHIATLLVYRNPHSAYQYQILLADGSLFQAHELYPTASLALKVGREMTELVNSYQSSDNE